MNGLNSVLLWNSYLIFPNMADNIREHNPKDHTSFGRCIDIMSRLILKYGSDTLEDRAERNA